MPKWIDKAARRPGEKELDVRHAAAALSEHTAARMDAAKVARAPMPSKPWLKPHPDDYPPAASCTVKGELKRFPPNAISLAHSPILDKLIGDGLVERVYNPEPPYLCLGFRLTAKGKAAR